MRRRERDGRPVSSWLAGALALACVIAAMYFALRRDEPLVQCGPGFSSEGTRCMPRGGCPSPLTLGKYGCDAPDVRVHVPDTTFTIGPGDWEAEGRVVPRTVHVAPFDIDAFEATVAKVLGRAVPDGARAAAGLSRADAAAYCAARGGRLPTDDEWIAAAAGDKSRRYPWGDTGAVCRRAAWGLSQGPCALDAPGRASGPDTVGAHPDGDTPSGIHDLAGNVAEWVSTDVPGRTSVGIVRGGSFRTSLATELRTWHRVELRTVEESAEAKRDDVGVRCAY